MNLGDRFNLTPLPYVPGTDTSSEEEPSVAAGAEQMLEEASEARALGARACDETITKVFNDQRVELARENWGQGEYQHVIEEANQYLEDQ